MKRIRIPFQQIAGGLAGVIILFIFVSAAFAQNPVLSPLEKTNYQFLTRAAERSVYLEALAAIDNPQVVMELKNLGTTRDGNPIEAVLIHSRSDRMPAAMDLKKLKILLIGSQHGNEVSGCEALLVFVGKLAANVDFADLLDKMTLMVIPASNPDGMERRQRVNALGVNLSTDYGLLSAMESATVNKALLEFQPHVVLDMHESALLKKKSLGAEGWLTDFEAQFEYANNPNVHPDLNRLTADTLLPEILQNVRAKGLPAGRYIGEITQTRQVITHGGLSAHNLRNKAGILGAASFLVENRLDPSSKVYSTPRNIKERVRKQLLCVRSFLNVCKSNADPIIHASQVARTGWQQQTQAWLNPEYTMTQTNPNIIIPLRRVDTGVLTGHSFEYHGRIVRGKAFPIPQAYRISGHMDFFISWLERQGIKATVSKATDMKPAYLEVSVKQPNGCLLPLYLEQGSVSSIIKRLPFAFDEIKIERVKN